MNLRDANNLVTRIEFAHEIGVSETTISKWIKRGIVPAPGIRIGLRKYWEPEELNTVKKKIMRRDD